MSTNIIIVSFNTKDLLVKTLSNLSKLKDNYKITVIDNNSSDNSAEMVGSSFPDIRLIKNRENLGFAKAVNQGVKSGQEELIFLMNPDAEFTISDVEKMVEFIQSDPQYAIASCRINYPSGEIQPNAGDLPVGIALVSWLFNLEALGSMPNFHQAGKKYYEKVKEVGWVGGTFTIIKKEVFEKLGYFDEEYFMYFEDVDFCFKTRKIGYKVMVNPGVVITHIGGASSNDPRFTQWRGEFKGLSIFYKKNFGILTTTLIKLMTKLAILLRVIAFAIIGRFKTSQTYGKVLFEN